MEEEHQHLNKPIYGFLQNLKNTQSREEEEEEEESMHQQRDLYCHYGLRENPKKKTQKSFGLESPESLKKIIFRCGECGKGFRYEKCLSNHRAGMHLSSNQRVNEEPMKTLCSSFSLVRKKKRSQVMRYKRTPLSCSFTTFLEPRSVFAANAEELEVAECLILLSMSSPKVVGGLKLVAEAMNADLETPIGCLSNKKPRKAGEFESGYFSNEQKLMEERVCSYKKSKAVEFESEFSSNEQKLAKEGITTDETFKEPASFLGHKCELDLQKGGEYGSEFVSNEQKLMEETWKEPASFLGEKKELDKRKSCDIESGFYRTEFGGAMECCDSETESDKRNFEHQCRLCNKIFSSYQALGGHQTFHRVSRSKKKNNCREESVEPEDESVKKEDKTHKCSICSRKFRSVHALGGHKKCHRKRQHSKTEDDEDLGVLSVVPVTVGIEFY